MSINKLQAVSDLARVLDQAEHFLPRVYDQSNMAEPFDFVMFVQSWSDTSLGFGGFAGQAFTAGTVVVCWRERGKDAAVFIGGNFAYPVHKDDERLYGFWKDLDRLRTVQGADVWIQTCKHRVPKNSNVCDFCGRGQPVVNR
jgi:hypothetical protein